MHKKLSVFLFLILVAVTSRLEASEHWEFDHKAIQLLNRVFNSCPVEFIQAMRGADSVGKASFSSDRTGEKISLTTVGGGFAPTFQFFDVSTLVITRTRIIEENPPPDAPAQFRVTCSLSDAAK